MQTPEISSNFSYKSFANFVKFLSAICEFTTRQTKHSLFLLECLITTCLNKPVLVFSQYPSMLHSRALFLIKSIISSHMRG